jgi:DNA-binding XRE family transcriptional regulator
MFQNPQQQVRILLLTGDTPSTISKKTKIAKSTIYRIERGFTRNPSVKTSKKLQSLFHQSIVIPFKSKNQK